MRKVRILNGEYGGKVVTDTVFPLCKGWKLGKRGGFITVDGSKVVGYPDRKIRIKLGKDGYEPMVPKAEKVRNEQTDEERMKEIRERFEILDEMTEATMEGTVRGMIVSGPPGVGKSFGVEAVLEKANIFNKIGSQPVKYDIIKGAMTPIGLYTLLYNWADKGKVLVLDDCDTILFDELALNLLKGALDSGKKRRLFWNADSSMLRRTGVPDYYEFNGSIIFISNLKFDNMVSGGRLGKVKDHLKAILSRCHYLDLTLDTMRDKILRIKQVVGDGMLDDHKLAEGEKEMIVKYIDDNKEKLREVSLRMVLKIADLFKMAPRNEKWKRLAEMTCMKREVVEE